MVSIKTVAAPPAGGRRHSVEYAAIVEAATAKPGQWLEIEIEGRTQSQLGSIAQRLKKLNALFEVTTRTVNGKPVLYLKAPEVVKGAPKAK
jgi:hypothetical protein